MAPASFFTFVSPSVVDNLLSIARCLFGGSLSNVALNCLNVVPHLSLEYSPPSPCIFVVSLAANAFLIISSVNCELLVPWGAVPVPAAAAVAAGAVVVVGCFTGIGAGLGTGLEVVVGTGGVAAGFGTV